ncbi:hypothetical protein [Ekhidna sp.]|uniref:hypothetical protein n=1 Tax=Ekhidna sp. TaxID=2608089 RepID=UPI003519949F
MGIKDLIITPIYLVLFTMIAYFVRPYVTNAATSKFFLPALWVRFIGAILLGVLYQFYYGGGDTFNYWQHGSRWIYLAFQDDPAIGLNLLLDNGGDRALDRSYEYSSKIWYYRDVHSYLIVRIAAIFDLLTFHTYSASALFFACFSFSGLWAMYSAIQEKYPSSTERLTLAILFVPSVIFWGSGILKDTITLGALGWATWALMRMICNRKRRLLEAVVLISALYIIYSIKLYILICYLPMVAIWLFFESAGRLRSWKLKILAMPFLLLVFGGVGFLALRVTSGESEKYALDNLAERARITAYDIRYGWGARLGGDGGYDIGIPDGSISGMFRLMPAAVNVSLFRPYLWEVKNPLMLLAALEGLIFLLLTVRFVFKKRVIKRVFSEPFLIFCLGFAVLFAFAIGVSTANFGTLIRYKIPMIPFIAILLLTRLSRPENR